MNLICYILTKNAKHVNTLIISAIDFKDWFTKDTPVRSPRTQLLFGMVEIFSDSLLILRLPQG
jgi:hypothetical protein